MTWLTPDGRENSAGATITPYAQRHRFSEDSRLMRRLDGVAPQQALFTIPDAEERYRLKENTNCKFRPSCLRMSRI
jgi:hypothetical protein